MTTTGFAGGCVFARQKRATNGRPYGMVKPLASLSEGGGPRSGGGSVVNNEGHSPSQKSEISDSPLSEGAKRATIGRPYETDCHWEQV